jgi:hypothetical protein
MRVVDKAVKSLFGVWTAVCVGFVIFAFVAAPAWDTSRPAIFGPNGLGLFILALVVAVVAWTLGVLLLLWADRYS